MKLCTLEPELTKRNGKYCLRITNAETGDTFKVDDIADQNQAEMLRLAFHSFFHFCCAASQGITVDEYLKRNSPAVAEIGTADAAGRKGIDVYAVLP